MRAIHFLPFVLAFYSMGEIGESRSPHGRGSQPPGRSSQPRRRHPRVPHPRVEAPAIEISPNVSTRLREGASAYFRCRVVAGSPPPRVQWKRADGGRFATNIRDDGAGVLRIENARNADAGAYICRATNAAGSAEATAALTIRVERNNFDDDDEYDGYGGDGSGGDGNGTEEGAGDHGGNNDAFFGNYRHTKPEIMVTGICATSPQLPCCERMLRVFEMFSRGHVADLSYPDCRPNGYFSPKQCMFGVGCYCVTRNGRRTPGIMDTDQRWDNIECEDSPVKPVILSTGICATSPLLPCCEKTKEAFERSTNPRTYPSCRPDGFFQPKQCKWVHSCRCVTKTGERIRTVPIRRYERVTCQGAVTNELIIGVVVGVVVLVILLVFIIMHRRRPRRKGSHNSQDGSVTTTTTAAAVAPKEKTKECRKQRAPASD